MKKKIATLLVYFSSVSLLQAQFQPVKLKGFTEDIVANGIGDANKSTSTAAGTADSNWALVSADFKALSTDAAPLQALPANGTLTDASMTYIKYQLEDYGAKNSLQLTPGHPSDTLHFDTPLSASAIYVAVFGTNDPLGPMAYPPSLNAVFIFTDGTTQTGLGSIQPWMQPIINSYVVTNMGRVGRGSAAVPANQLYTGTSGPALFRQQLSLQVANYTKKIKDVVFSRPTSATPVTYVNIMAITARTFCPEPADQPGSLTWGAITTKSIAATFTEANSKPSNYLVVRYLAGATPSHPILGTNYTVGQALGQGTVVASLPASNTKFTATGLNAATMYDFYIYSATGNAANACAGPVYQIQNPLKLSKSTAACTGPIGTLSVGPGGNFPTLTAALVNINTVDVGIAGPVVLELRKDYTSAGETFPIIIKSNNCYSSENKITIRPASGANGLVIASGSDESTILIKAAEYVTIDGKPGGSTGSETMPVTATGSYNTTYLNITNTSNKGVAVKVDSGSVYMTLRYCDLQGQNTEKGANPSVQAGVVYIGNGAANGNDNLLVDHCNIHATSQQTTPSRGIYAYGVANTRNDLVVSFHDSGIIRNNNIYDYFSIMDTSAGVQLYRGNNAWTISDNHFFQTTTRTFTGDGVHRPIWINSRISDFSVGNSFVIQNNFIGGSAPKCAGDPYTVNGDYNTLLEAISLDVADGPRARLDNVLTYPSSLQGNTIQGIRFSTATQGVADTFKSAFHGIAAYKAGRLEIGNITENRIGSTTQNESIVISGRPYTGSAGILINNKEARVSGNPPIAEYTVNNNAISGIKMTSSGILAGIFIGPYSGNSPVAAVEDIVRIANNKIGSPSMLHSLVAENSADMPSVLGGILVSSGKTLGTLNIFDNSVTNLSNLSTASAGANLYGIGIGYSKPAATTATNNVTGNKVSRLYTKSNTSTGGYASALIGILANSTKSINQNISSNSIDSLIADGNAGVQVNGLCINGSDTFKNNVAKNLVHSLNAPAAHKDATVNGIYCAGGSSNVLNNMIRLGITSSGVSISEPVAFNGIVQESDKVNNFYFNSIYIGGSNVSQGVTGAPSTYGFLRKSVATLSDIRNNIFYNARSNSGVGGKHYAIGFIGSNLNAQPNYNVYYAPGTGGHAAFNGASDVTQYTTGWLSGDTNSRSLDPKFINPVGNSSTLDLHISKTVVTPIESGGILIESVTEDYDGDTRKNLTPTDIGADAGLFLAPSVSINGTTALCVGSTLTLTGTTQLPNPTFKWTGPNNFSATGATLTINSITLTQAGNYTMTATSGSANYSASTAVTVTDYPTITQISSNGPVCTGSEIKLSVKATGTGTLGYQWIGPNGFNAAGADAAKSNGTSADAGKYKVTVTAGICGRSDSVTVQMVLSPDIQSIKSNTPVCTGSNLDLFVKAESKDSLSYQWRGPNNFGSNEQNPVRGKMSSADGGYYVVTVTGGKCTDVDSIAITTQNGIQLQPIQQNGPLCPGDSLQLSGTTSGGSGTVNYEWSGPNGFSSLKQQTGKNNVIHADSGLYILKVADDQCAAVDSVVVIVHQMDKPTISRNDYVLQTGTYDSYQWLMNGTAIPGADKATYEVADNGDYQVAVSITAGCRDTSAVQKVTDYLNINSLSDLTRRITVFPNPATQVVQVHSPIPVQLKLSTVDGRLILQESNTSMLSLEYLAAGMYWLQIADLQGNLLKTEKLVKAAK